MNCMSGVIGFSKQMSKYYNIMKGLGLFKIKFSSGWGIHDLRCTWKIKFYFHFLQSAGKNVSWFLYRIFLSTYTYHHFHFVTHSWKIRLSTFWPVRSFILFLHWEALFASKILMHILHKSTVSHTLICTF